MLAAPLAVALIWAACDAAPGPAALNPTPPQVTNLVVAPETVRAADLSPDQLANGQALADLSLAVEARDADGSVDRVLAIIDPAFGSSPAGIAQLEVLDSTRYGGVLRYGFAADRADVLTLRAIAIDNDSLTSNEAVVHVHFIPDSSAGARS